MNETKTRWQNPGERWGAGALRAGILATMCCIAVNAEEKKSEYEMAAQTVIGSKDNVKLLHGSGDFLDSTDIQTHAYDDINQVLRRVPGVYVREEDGYGLFPNISLRGVDSGRSSKVTIMEDGVLSAPAPYSAPAIYGALTTARMSGIEVLKGSSQIKYGPSTTGGVVNYLSTPIPKEASFYSKLMLGTDHEIRVHTHYGDTVQTAAGNVGYLFEVYDRRTDGFKTIDGAPGFTATDKTGFRRTEPSLKLSWEPNSERYNRIEFKITHTETDANETYMGLTDADFDANPTRRYAASRFDNIAIENTRLHLRHLVELTESTRLTSTAYYTELTRNWFKDRSTGADLADPAKLAVIKGEAAGSLRYRNNDRDYYAAGIESVVQHTFTTGEVAHTLDVGVRLHQDEAKRFQRDDTFVQDANGAILARQNGIPGGGGNRAEDAESVAVFVQDSMKTGKWTFVPGVRYEHVRFSYTDLDTKGDPGKVTGRGDNSLDVYAPGLGIVRELTETTALFGGVYRGFSLPDARGSAKDDVAEETSLSGELGVRYTDREALSSEFSVFYTQFSDLIVPELLGAGGSGSTENVGDVNSYGAEFKLGYDVGKANGWAFRNPWHVAMTWTTAELDSDSSSADSESIFSGGRKGAKVPYVPEVQFVVGTGLENDVWGIFVDAAYTDATFSTASNTSSPVDSEGNPDFGFGKTDAHVLVDLSGFYTVKQGVRLLGTVQNLFDEEYVASRHPTGSRPGKPVTALAGVEIKF